MGAESTVKTLLARLITGEFNSPVNSPVGPASPLERTEDDMHGLNTGSTFYTVEVTVKTLLARVITGEFNSPANSPANSPLFSFCGRLTYALSLKA